jgi:hypothetical protein
VCVKQFGAVSAWDCAKQSEHKKTCLTSSSKMTFTRIIIASYSRSAMAGYIFEQLMTAHSSSSSSYARCHCVHIYTSFLHMPLMSAVCINSLFVQGHFFILSRSLRFHTCTSVMHMHTIFYDHYYDYCRLARRLSHTLAANLRKSAVR